MADKLDNKILIREYNEDRDIKVVGKLEKNCEIRSNKEVSIFTHMMGDPLCRIRFYPVHIMLVAELRENGELVGVVRGCIKCVGTRFSATYVRLGCILGLRVSPKHRRMGIGLKLVKSVEEWLVGNGAHYFFLATEKNNVASTNLFTSKCNYINFGSLVIFVQQASLPVKSLSEDIKIEKLQIDQAISLYNNKLRGKDIYPTDIDALLKEKLSLGTWVSYFKEDEWIILHNNEKNHEDEDILSKTPSSWVIFSIWNSCEAYKLHIRKSHHPLKFFHATLSHARDKILPCLKLPICDSLQKPFGFLFLYGLYGEGARLQELMRAIWIFTSRMAENVKDCKVITTELGVTDPLMQYVPHEPSMSFIDDLWYLKKVNGITTGSNDELMAMGQAGNLFVDPRDF
ncbi:probable N-acetyltransferase HLS1-like [Ricinus communis]|uniref:N-acetyltransferase, putative n=1 Tax=Ricinus communis TaxID=3988 RepID=B9RZQ2_RICCO|nr:probable N-acetyltransferase HLS1-like [Ricinus communis]EEF43085.1 N-acetyltransferase, putative [Ricinus communis]|eukprot:XP_015574696.2 probable N-acetyltransferase HLS1-like [Ricinus communis]